MKTLAAYRGGADGTGQSPDAGFIFACEDMVVDKAAPSNKLWLGDHFALCNDPGVPQAEREAYSIYASNGLLYLLAAGLDPTLTHQSGEVPRDLASAAAATARRYGSVHTSVNNESQWVSQNMWRGRHRLLAGDGWVAAGPCGPPDPLLGTRTLLRQQEERLVLGCLRV